MNRQVLNVEIMEAKHLMFDAIRALPGGDDESTADSNCDVCPDPVENPCIDGDSSRSVTEGAVRGAIRGSRNGSFGALLEGGIGAGRGMLSNPPDECDDFGTESLPCPCD